MALFVFAAGVGVESIADLTGWTLTGYRIWFVFGATLAAATLGLGSLYFALSPRPAQVATAAVCAGAVWVAYRMLTVPIDASAVIPRVVAARPPSVVALPGDVTALVIVLNSFGTLALVGCALWTAVRFRRSDHGGARALANLF